MYKHPHQARKEHVEHILGPAKGGPINRINTKERFQLDLPRSAAHGSGGNSTGDSSADLQNDDSDDDDDDEDGADGTKGKKMEFAGLGRVRGALDGRERQDRDRGGEAKKKGKWRGMLSHRSASSTVASVDEVGEATLARGKTGDHGGSTRKIKPSKRDTTKVEGTAAPTSGSASASVFSSSTEAGGKKRENKAAAPDVPDMNNKKTKPKPKTKAKAKTKTKRNSSDDHASTNESVEDPKAVVVDGDGSDRKKPKSQKRPTAGATAGTRKNSSASSFLAQESTGRSLESSQYFSAESQSSHARESERESSRDGEEKETAAAEESATRASDGRRRSRRSSRRRTRRESAEGRSLSSLEGESKDSVDGQTGKNRETSSTRLVARQTSNTITSGGGGEGGTQAVGSKDKKTTTSAAEARKAPTPQPDTQKKEKSDSRRRRSSHSHVSRRSTERHGRGGNSEVKSGVTDAMLTQRRNGIHPFIPFGLLLAPLHNQEAEQSKLYQYAPDMSMNLPVVS